MDYKETIKILQKIKNEVRNDNTIDSNTKSNTIKGINIVIGNFL